MTENVNKHCEIDKKMNALQLATKFMISTKWLELSEKENSIALQNYKSKNEGLNVLNESVLIAFAYMIFVIPKESSIFNDVEVDDTLNNLINQIDFSVYTYNDDRRNVNSVIKHIRNALSHANIFFDENLDFEFYDKSMNGNEARFKMSLSNFSNFIEEVYDKQKNKYFKQRKQ